VTSLRLSVALQLFLVFASGAVVGGLAYRLYEKRLEVPEGPRMPPPPPPDRGRGASFRQRYVQELRDRLKLRPDQLSKLNEILETTGRKFFEARKRADMEIMALQENQQAQIRALLDPDQAAEYDRMLKEREEFIRRSRERMPGRRP